MSVTITRRVTKDRLRKVVPHTFRDLRGGLSAPEPMTVIVFNDDVVISGILHRALHRLGDDPAEPLVFVGADFTRESRQAVEERGAWIIARGDESWTDQSYEDVRTLIRSKVKSPDWRR
jgi:hypothetical protein